MKVEIGGRSVCVTTMVYLNRKLTPVANKTIFPAIVLLCFFVEPLLKQANCDKAIHPHESRSALIVVESPKDVQTVDRIVGPSKSEQRSGFCGNDPRSVAWHLSPSPVSSLISNLPVESRRSFLADKKGDPRILIKTCQSAQRSNLHVKI
jgi:hypothetical protein